ncbi:hypothetical protein GCM10023155_11360 [Bremerella cremea]
MRGVAVFWLLFFASPLFAQDGGEPSPMSEEPAEAETPMAEPEPSKPATPDFANMSSREFFAMIDFGPSYLEMLIDGEPLAQGEQEAVIRAVTRLRRLQPHRITRWLSLETPWQELLDNPKQHRLDFFLLTGTVQAVREVSVPAEAIENVGLATYYEVDVRFDETEGNAQGTIIVEQIPQAWRVALNPEKNVVGERFSCPGIFLKSYEREDGQRGYVFVSPKLSWHPEKPNPALGVTPALVRLAEQGMDIGELSHVVDRAKFEGLEREPFYQMMAAVTRLPIDQQMATSDKDVSQLLTLPKNGLMVSPETYRGEFIPLYGLCRRITRIEIDDDDVRERLGLDHYYELSVFVPIPAPIVSQRPGDESTRKEFANDYPVLVCVPELPAGLKVGEQLHQPIEVVGPFFKLWAYRTPFMSREDFTRRQISPLFIASNVRLSEQKVNLETNNFVLAVLIILGVVIGMGVAFGLILGRKSSSRRR